MKLSYSPPNGSTVNLDDLGLVYIQSQQSQFVPPELPQREIRALTVKIEFWEDGFARNYSALRQVRDALKVQGGTLKWLDEQQQNTDGTLTTGETFLEQEVIVESMDVPEDPNAWGTFQQSITIVFKYEVTDLVQGDTYLTAKFAPTNAGGEVTLGNVTGWKEDFRTQRYDELKNLRSRSSGSVTASGQFVSAGTGKLAERRAALFAMKKTMDDALNDKDGQLTYGAGGKSVFDRKVKLDSFTCEVDQATWTIHWSLSASYTIFPNEDGYAAADYKVNTTQDQETGDLTMTLAGKIAAATEAIALAKLDAVIAAVVTGNWNAGHLIRFEQDKNILLTDDGSAFTELSFNRIYRRRAPNIVSYTLNIAGGDESRSGLVQRSYSGSVVATASTDSAAYSAALNKALELGANKHPIQVSAKLTRGDRQVSGGSREFVRLEFAFDYEVKSKRIWVEMQSESANEVFGEYLEQVSGSIVAETAAAARELYDTKIRTLYTAAHVRNERTGNSKMMVGTGTYGVDGFTPDKSLAEVPAKFDFAFTVWHPKPTGTFALKYGMEVEVDFVSLRNSTTLRGRVYADPAALEAIKSASAGNRLDTFLAGFNLGKLAGTSRNYEWENDGVESDTMVGVEFRNTYLNTVTSPHLILASEVSEELVYSAKRWVFQPVPDPGAPVVPQECGLEPGRRSVSGSVTAATEAEAMRFVKKIHGSLWNTFPSGVGGGARPGVRYEDPVRITRSWETLPLTELNVTGSPAANRMANATFCKVSFNFAETLPVFAPDSLDI